MRGNHVEYIGFTAGETTRQFNLRVRQPDGEVHAFALCIANEAFVADRVRYQDGPEICFRKLERALLESGGVMPESNMDVSDAELEDFREAQKPKSKQRR